MSLWVMLCCWWSSGHFVEDTGEEIWDMDLGSTSESD